MIVGLFDLVIWFPAQLLKCLLQPATALTNFIADETEEAIREYAEEHGLN